jgi:hypothetical protein
MSVLVSALSTLKILLISLVAVCPLGCSSRVVVGTGRVGSVVVIATAVLIIAVSASLVDRLAVCHVERCGARPTVAAIAVGGRRVRAELVTLVDIIDNCSSTFMMTVMMAFIDEALVLIAVGSA